MRNQVEVLTDEGLSDPEFELLLGQSGQLILDGPEFCELLLVLDERHARAAVVRDVLALLRGIRGVDAGRNRSSGESMPGSPAGTEPPHRCSTDYYLPLL